MKRLENPKPLNLPVFVVTPEEAKRNDPTNPKPDWHFSTKNTRLCFHDSRKFIRMPEVAIDGGPTEPVMAIFLPKWAEPLWSKYSTQAVAHTLDVYSRYVLPYPYPVAISVNGPIEWSIDLLQWPKAC